MCLQAFNCHTSVLSFHELLERGDKKMVEEGILMLGGDGGRGTVKFNLKGWYQRLAAINQFATQIALLIKKDKI